METGKLSPEDTGLSEEDMQVETASQPDKSAEQQSLMEFFRKNVKETAAGKWLITFTLLAGAMTGEKAMAGEVNHAKEFLKTKDVAQRLVNTETVASLHLANAQRTEEGVVADNKEVFVDSQLKLGDAYFQTKGFDGDYTSKDIVKSIGVEDARFYKDIVNACPDKATASEIKAACDKARDALWGGGKEKWGGKASLVNAQDESESLPIAFANLYDAKSKVNGDIEPLIGKINKMSIKDRIATMGAIAKHELEHIKIGIVDAMRDAGNDAVD